MGDQGRPVPWRRALRARVRRVGGAALRRLRAYGPSVALAAGGAGVAYAVASALVGPEDAVFAPIAAVVTTGLASGQRLARAAEIAAGVVLGVVVADVVARVVGTGVLQLVLTVGVAMTAAVLLRPSGLFANQSAVAAVVVVVLVPVLDTGPWVRLADAVIGGTVAVALNAVLAPDPYRVATSTAERLLGRYAAVVRRLARAVRDASLDEAEGALSDLAVLDNAQGELRDALASTRERLVVTRTARRRRRANLRPVRAVAGRTPAFLATGRALCRATANLVRHADPPVEPQGRDGSAGGAADHRYLVDALRDLADALDGLRTWVLGRDDGTSARTLALRAATTASRPADGTRSEAILVGQVRSAAVDVLRATGVPRREAVATLEEHAGRADEPWT